MKQHSKFMTALVAALLVAAPSVAQTAASAGKKPVHRKHRTVRSTRRPVRRPVENATDRQLHDLRETVTGQQVEIDNLKSQITARDQQVSQAQQSVADAQSQIAAAAQQTSQAAQQSTQNAQDVQQLKASVSDLSTQNTNLQQTVVQNQQQVQEEINSPTLLHYKGVTIQPVAFFAFEGVWRQRSVNSDINTPFNSIPLPSANEGHVSELNFTGRQSRLGALFSGDTGPFKLSGYFESDFLGAGVTSNNNQSNSYVFRVRQIWGQAATKAGFTVTGGQMWSLVTENGRGTDNRNEVLPNTVDSQYMVGFNWTRQPAIRLQQRLGNPKTGTVTLAASLEQAQITNFTAASPVSGAVPTNFFFSGAGANGGLYNAFNGTYANNVAPDVIVKAAFDAPHIHAEVGGLARFLRDYYYPVTSTALNAAGAETYVYGPRYQSSTASAGGGFASFRVNPLKPVEFGIQGMAGEGMGRYGSAQLADATVKPSGALEPIHNYHGLASLVTHEGKNLDIYAYYGGEYDQRTTYYTAAGAAIGYGVANLNDTGCYALPTNPASSTGGSDSVSATTCVSPTRYIQEGMAGFTYRVVNSPRYGRLQYQATYSYLQRNLWSGIGSSTSPRGPRAEDNMIHVSMRYYIP